MHELRPFQIEALAALRRPAHVICVAPTGSGKSLIYETRAAEAETRTVLVTPLTALARQQEASLRARGLPVLSATGGIREIPEPGSSGVWIVSPESLAAPPRARALERWKPGFLVVDECHCLWEWGERFRPSFSRLPDLIRSAAIPRSLWLTATLPYEARLGLRERLPGHVREIGSFSLPPSIHLSVRHVAWVDRASALLSWVARQEGAGLVFVTTRESCARVARLIAGSGRKTLAYHAGLSLEERRAAETMIRARVPDVVVATSAFGMGMHQPHLRWVAHWQAPLSLLSLAQTIGRAGRDLAQPARALILWDADDFRLLEWATRGSRRGKEEALRTLRFLERDQCRSAGLRSYFDRDPAPRPCENCDFCDDTAARLAVSKFSEKQRIFA